MATSYVLITPARNEEAFIEQTIKSVIEQTILPLKWVIVSDGSTDHTDEIVRAYLPGNPWIEFIRMPEHRDRHFAAKVECFNAGYEKVKGLDFDIIGNLDADISFDKEYLKYLLDKFAEDPTLGVAGTPYVEDGKHYDYRFTNIEHVSGACQLFRRACFEDIGGYTPIKGGGIDWVAVTTARMKGWKTRTFTDKTCLHHRKIGTGNASPLLTWFKQGRKDYVFGNHPLWEAFRAFYQMGKKPYIIGGKLLLSGFVWAALKRTDRPISAELMEFVHKEQMQRLKKALHLKQSPER
jgi:glycosyltransferase involved in cell wall biosynthesis